MASRLCIVPLLGSSRIMRFTIIVSSLGDLLDFVSREHRSEICGEERTVE